MKIWALLLALVLTSCGAQAAQPVGALLVQNNLSEIASAGSAAQLAARNNLGISSIGTLTTITDGVNSFPVATTLQFTGGTVSSSTGKVIVTITAAATSVAVGTTTVSGTTSGYFLNSNAGVLGGVPPSGTGNVVLNSGPSITSLTVLTAFTATGLVTNADLANPATTVNGQTCTLGSACTVAAAAGTLTGTTLASNVVTSSLTSAAGGSFAALAFLANAPAGSLTGTTLASNVVTSSLTSAAGGSFGTAAFVATGTSGATVGLLNANLTFGGIDTWSSGNIRMLGSGGGYTSEASLNASGTNYTWSKPAFNGTYLGYTSGSAPTGGCLTLVSAGGPVTTTTCGSGGGSLTVADNYTDAVSAVTTLNIFGGAVSGSAGTATWIPTAPPRLIGASTATATVGTGDMGNMIVLQDNAGGTITFPAVAAGLWQNGQTVLICNESTGAWTISTTPAIVGSPGSIPAMVNSIPVCMYVTSDGTALHPFWGGDAPNAAFLNQANNWTAPQRGSYSTPTISTATFTPAIGTSQNFRINLVHASCPCTLANPSGTLVAGQQGVIEIKQSSTGSDVIGTWGSEYEYSGGTATITLSSTASAVDYLSYAVDSTASFVVLAPIVQSPVH